MTINDKLLLYATTLRQLAERIHCPDSEGGKVAAAIKVEVLQVAANLENETKPTPVPSGVGGQQG